MSVRSSIDQINSIDYNGGSLEEIAYSIYILSLGFREALSIALSQNSNNNVLVDIALEELKTDNLDEVQYGIKLGKLDHAEYMEHFIVENAIKDKVSKVLQDRGETFLRQIKEDSQYIGVIANFENNMPPFYRRITEHNDISNGDWLRLKNFCEKHVELDGEVGGHGEQLKKWVDDKDPISNKFFENFLEIVKLLK